MATWEDQYLVYFPIVTGCGRVFKVPCSLTTMRQLLTEETGDRMDVMIKNFFENIKMENPSEDLLAMEFINPASVGTTIEREHSYAKPFTSNPMDRSYLAESDDSDL
ncbi:hypothetical protein DAPPUDRAFT_317778 [Daphnia pulex]|uniref:Uncharacterized protein n=1 Tax=Daphnia pulex TaxID=6669 RepID=E9GGY1_DAPPU|nr:hypothetical protein DAPPUDRAFT_317778 [Daphnia pulex]|eukprot:EFX81105.1 hypothetical protein DAPPUDRAFT_317778 [Daphnia pulex]